MVSNEVTGLFTWLPWRSLEDHLPAGVNYCLQGRKYFIWYWRFCLFVCMKNPTFWPLTSLTRPWRQRMCCSTSDSKSHFYFYFHFLYFRKTALLANRVYANTPFQNYFHVRRDCWSFFEVYYIEKPLPSNNEHTMATLQVNVIKLTQVSWLLKMFTNEP